MNYIAVPSVDVLTVFSDREVIPEQQRSYARNTLYHILTRKEENKYN